MNDYTKAVIDELESAGIAWRHCSHGSKHRMVEWDAPGGKTRQHQVDNTYSDFRAVMNARRDVRQMLAADGMLPKEDRRVRLYLSPGGQPYCSTLDVASDFKKSRKDVLRALDRIIVETGQEFTERNFAPSTYLDGSGRSVRCFELTRDGFVLLAMGFTGQPAMEWKVKYLRAFNEMEERLLGRDELRDRIAFLEGELKAATELMLETQRPALPCPSIIKKSSVPFMRASVKRQLLKLSRGATPQ